MPFRHAPIPASGDRYLGDRMIHAGENGMHRPEALPRERAQWVICLTAIAQVVDRLPALYRIVEPAEDDVRFELHMKSSAWEILRLAPANEDHVAVTLSRHLDNTPGSLLEAWLSTAIEAFEADVSWAASRPCPDQASELLSALIRLRGSMLHGNLY
jgi:hypothetical protein